LRTRSGRSGRSGRSSARYSVAHAMRRARVRAVVLLLACASAARGASDDDRLLGWLGEVGRGGGAVASDAAPMQRWIEPIAWKPRCAAAGCVPPTAGCLDA
jgi:hypothetical protein